MFPLKTLLGLALRVLPAERASGDARHAAGTHARLSAVGQRGAQHIIQYEGSRGKKGKHG